MLQRWLAIALVGASLLVSAPVSAADEFDLGRTALERIDGAPGVGIAIGTIENGKTSVVFRGETGTAAKLGRETVFEIGSVTKTFTALLLAQMVGNGDVRLDQPIDTLLPKDVNPPSRDGRPITLLDLATQTSGLPRLPDNFGAKNPADPYAQYDDARLFDFIGHYRLTRAPGSAYEYSNLGFGLLGRLLASQAGRSYDVLLRERVLEPLGMIASGVGPAPQLGPRFAVGHDADADPVPYWNLNALAGAGGMHASLNDMLRYLGAVMTAEGPLGPAARIAEQPRRDATPGLRIGLAWNTTVSDGIVWHNGATGGFHAFIGFDATRTRGIVMLTNSALSIDDIALHWLDPVSPLAEALHALPLDRGVLARYAGTYDLAGKRFVVSVEGDRLYAKLGEQARYRIYPYAADAFFWKAVPARVTFSVTDGRAVSLVLHQGGRAFTAERLPD